MHRAEITREKQAGCGRTESLPHSIIATIFRFSLSGDGGDDDGGQL
jgi:hypothetical protein